MTSGSKKNAMLRLFTITVFIMLASIDNCVLDMASSVYTPIGNALRTTESFEEMMFFLGLVNSVLIWIVASLAIVWGYLGDRGNRKRLLLIGTLIWSVSLLFTPLVTTKLSWLLVQCIAGVGLACIASVGFSVIVDFVSPEKRGLALGFWGLSQGLGTALGKGAAALMVTGVSNWWHPFILFSVAGFVMIGLYFFTMDPKRGGTEKELKGVDYDYRIKAKDIVFIFKKKTNIALMLQGLFGQVVWGALTWLPNTFLLKLESQGLSEAAAILAGNIVGGLFGLGGVFSIPFGDLGDRLQKRSLKARSLLSAICMLVGIPLFITMLLVPFSLSDLSGVEGTFNIIGGLLYQLGANTLFLTMFVLSIAAAGLMSASSANAFALIGDVNYPEHRGTMFGLGNFINGIGRGIGSLLLPAIAVSLTSIVSTPDNYIWGLIIIQLFFIPAALSYFWSTRHVASDIAGVKNILVERAKQYKIKDEAIRVEKI